MAMHVGVLTVNLEVTDALTLKDKRQVVRSLLAKIRQSFNVSAAEVGQLNSHTLSTFGIAAVANDKAYVNGLLERVVDLIERETRAQLVDYALELL